MNLSSQRIWCYLCECEVYFPTQANNRSRPSFSTASSIESQSRFLHCYQDSFQGEGASSISGSDYDDEEFDHQNGRLNGLIGLKNIANTCYMNAALQALSNSPPLTRYFLKCGNYVQKRTARSKIGLAKCYTRLITEMWLNERRGYIVPDEIIRGISTIHPMFRGYQQHDTQEFLRCFMDQLHEELKEITKPAEVAEVVQVVQQQQHYKMEENEDSVSEAEYETCDSGVSEQSNLSDEVSISSKRTRKISRSPSPPMNQRHNISSTSSCQNVMMNRSGSSSSLNQENSSSINNNSNQQPKAVHRSIISDVFDGKLLSSVQCLTCDRVSTREETFQDLSLPIPGRDHLSVLHQTQNPHPLNINIGQNSGGSSCTNVVKYQESWMWWIFVWLKSWFWGPAVSLHDCMGAFFSADELKGNHFLLSCNIKFKLI
jgi:ubiquitin carboxyl-terminal hydrolase 20/33